MKKILLILLPLILLFSFKPKFDNLSDLEYKLRNLTSSFATKANKDACDYLFRDIDALKSEINKAIGNQQGNLTELKKLQKKTDAFYDFAATLTRCKGNSSELDIPSFNTFMNETGLSPVFIKSNDCVAVYRVNINGFQSFYAVNTGSAKTVKIIIKKGDQYNSSVANNSFGIMCNSVEGFQQGEAQGKFNTMTITCTPLDSQFFDCN